MTTFTSPVPVANTGPVVVWAEPTDGAPQPGHLQVSETRDIVCDKLTELKNKTHSPYKYMGLAMRICCYSYCCSTDGLGLKGKKTCCTWLKAKSIKWSSNCCAGIGLFFGSILSCGYLAVKDCLGRRKDAEESEAGRDSARVHPV